MNKKCPTEQDSRHHNSWNFSFCKACRNDIVRALTHTVSMSVLVNDCDTFKGWHIHPTYSETANGWWYYESSTNTYHWKLSNESRRRILKTIDNSRADQTEEPIDCQQSYGLN
jgi:hypothetical protein